MKPSCVGAASSDDNGPEFFKVFLPSFSSYQLEIPHPFINYFKGKLPSKAILKDQTGKSWHVDFKELDEEYFFMNGWQAFVDDHLLEYGDFLIFRYLGNYIFNVKIFGKNGCIKNFMETANHLVPDAVISITDDSDFDQTETNTTASSGQKLSEVGSKRHADRPKKRATKFNRCPSKSEATKHDSSKYLFYEFIMTKWYLHKLHIPKSLIGEYNITVDPKLVLEDQRGKQWPVKFYYKDGRITLSAGWSACRASNNINIDDKCVVELVLNRANICRKMNLKIIDNHKYAPRNRGV